MTDFRLTPKQLRICQFIRRFQSKRGYAPTYDEIAAEFEISKVTVLGHVEAMCDAGALTYRPHFGRSIVLNPDLILPGDGRMCCPHCRKSFAVPEPASVLKAGLCMAPPAV